MSEEAEDCRFVVIFENAKKNMYSFSISSLLYSLCCVSLQGVPGPNGDIGPEGLPGKKVGLF